MSNMQIVLLIKATLWNFKGYMLLEHASNAQLDTHNANFAAGYQNNTFGRGQKTSFLTGFKLKHLIYDNTWHLHFGINNCNFHFCV